MDSFKKTSTSILGICGGAPFRAFAGNQSLASLATKLPYQKGCKRGRTIAQLYQDGWDDCYDLSAAQRKILEILNLKNEFRDVISVSYPGFQTWKHFEHGQHRAPGTDMDFVVLNSDGEPTHHPALMRAFQWLSSAEARAAGFVGGIGIGIINADPHLHVDMRRSSTIRWVEPDKTLGHEIVEGTENWPLFYLLAKNTYGWQSDVPSVSQFIPGSSGGWPLLPLALGAAGAAIGLSKDYLHAGAYGAGGLALGYVVHSIMKKLGADMEK